jgi:hypothetical protein
MPSCGALLAAQASCWCQKRNDQGAASLVKDAVVLYGHPASAESRRLTAVNASARLRRRAADIGPKYRSVAVALRFSAFYG